MSTRHSLSVCYIAKNESDNLARSIASIASVADEIIVADTGSCDGTQDLARSLGARLIDIQWTDDFSQARNASLEAASGDWVLCLDGDERFETGQNKTLRRLIRPGGGGGGDAYTVCLVSRLAGDQTGQVYEHLYPRLFRNRPSYRFRGRVHEQIGPSIMQAGGKIKPSGLRIDHTGYTLQGDARLAKSRRNLTLLLLDENDNPHDGLIQYHLGETYSVLSDNVRAVLAYENAIRSGELSMNHMSFAHQNLAAAENKLGNHREAEEHARQAIRIDRTAGPAYLILASALIRLGSYDEAVRAADRHLKVKPGAHAAVRFRPDPAKAWFLKGEALLRGKRVDEALESAEKSVHAAPGLAAGYRLRARVHIATGEALRAEADWKKALSIDPRDPTTWQALLTLQTRSGTPAALLSTADRAVAATGHPSLFEIQASLRLQSGDQTGAIQSFESALRGSSDPARIHRLLAGLHHRNGHAERARYHFDQINQIVSSTVIPSHEHQKTP